MNLKKIILHMAKATCCIVTDTGKQTYIYWRSWRHFGITLILHVNTLFIMVIWLGNLKDSLYNTVVIITYYFTRVFICLPRLFKAKSCRYCRKINILYENQIWGLHFKLFFIITEANNVDPLNTVLMSLHSTHINEMLHRLDTLFVAFFILQLFNWSC